MPAKPWSLGVRDALGLLSSAESQVREMEDAVDQEVSRANDVDKPSKDSERIVGSRHVRQACYSPDCQDANGGNAFPSVQEDLGRFAIYGK